MTLKTEIDAFDRIMSNMDKGFQAGAFGLRDAMQIVPDLQLVATLLNTPEPELINKFLAQPVNEWDQGEQISEDQIVVPGTNDKVAKKRTN
ncbi:hypothetical protein [Dyadobacter sp. CY312]|uniref:hypothetical protein n=1 Tax=Dyadobacter sp. CY312 TaxID=2907303 RepID=UPI001F3C53BD|nr:hypothetical protein [Dyadobacter sp. CY312]MCE7038998.1 hypothetical protein [Dyadobacter sp. CY312]